MVFVFVNACIRIDISKFAEFALKERVMIVTGAVIGIYVIFFRYVMMLFLEVDRFNMLMMSKTELIAVSGSICALCCFLFVMAEHCLFLCVSESINDLFCFICVYDLFRCFVLHVALLLICSCKDLISC